MSNGDGAYYEYEVQVNRDGEGQSFQHHQQVQQKQVGTLEPGGIIKRGPSFGAAKKVRFSQTHNQGLGQLFFMMSLEERKRKVFPRPGIIDLPSRQINDFFIERKVKKVSC